MKGLKNDGMSSRQSLSCGNGGGTIKGTAKVIHNRRPTIIVYAIGVANHDINELKLMLQAMIQ